MKFKNIIPSILLMLLTLNSFSQGIKRNQKSRVVIAQNTKTKQVKELKIGDRMPDVEMLILESGGVNAKKFHDFKQPLVILDFWDTSCKSCIEAMPKLDSLQRKFGAEVLILPTTFQDKTIIIPFLNNNKFLKRNNVKLPTVINDKLLSQYFRHRGVPHEVWIYKGIVSAITTADYIDGENIQKVLSGEIVNWPVKNDFLVYDNQTLINIDKGRFALPSAIQRYAVVTGYIKDTPRKSGSQIDSINKTIRDFSFNSSIIQSYYYAMSMIRPIPFSTASNRMVLEVKDTNSYLYNSKVGYRADWENKNSICFESVVADTTSVIERSKMIVDQLNHLLGLNGRLEKRKVKCLVLTHLDKQVHPVSIDTITFFNNRTITELIRWLDTSNLIGGQYPPIIDETNYSGILSLNEWKDISSLKIELQKQGFDINEAEREVELFVLTESNYKKQ